MGTVSRVEAFVFDMGGVVLKWKNSGQIYKYIARRYSVPLHSLTETLYPEVRLLDMGLGDADQTVVKVLGSLGTTLRGGDTGSGLISKPFEEKATLRRGVVNIIVGLRERGYRVAALTNTCEPHLKIMVDKGWTRLFDDFYASCRLGAAKPQPEAYLKAVRLMGVSPERTVFVDDRPENIVGAKAAGIGWPILFKTVPQLRHDIKRIIE